MRHSQLLLQFMGLSHPMSWWPPPVSSHMILLGLFGCPMGTPQPCSCDRHSWHVDSRRTFGGPWRGIAGVVVDEPRIRMDSWSISNVPIVCYLQCFSFWKLILLLPVTVTVARPRCEWSTHHATPESFWEQYIYFCFVSRSILVLPRVHVRFKSVYNFCDAAPTISQTVYQLRNWIYLLGYINTRCQTSLGTARREVAYFLDSREVNSPSDPFTMCSSIFEVCNDMIWPTFAQSKQTYLKTYLKTYTSSAGFIRFTILWNHLHNAQ